MDKEEHWGQTTFAHCKEPLAIKAKAENHQEADHLEKHQEEDLWEEDHLGEAHQQEGHWKKETSMTKKITPGCKQEK